MITAVAKVTGIYRSEAQWQEAEERRLLHLADAAAARRKPAGRSPQTSAAYDRETGQAAKGPADVSQAAAAASLRRLIPPAQGGGPGNLPMAGSQVLRQRPNPYGQGKPASFTGLLLDTYA
ncbi:MULTISPECIES: hypothetical protein [Paenibacillus]|uniref:hypothetical protein n=1 Tax=Paenibacillus TaxID=44249 RepID=UPI0022B881F1|nr:hypothetical protein [Paenibacillus caseinilyticus]MCZ8522847.1 hypothetical protein [Paenibacillus caseinilyticus]